MPALFVLDVTLVLLFAYFLAAALRPPTRLSFLISLYVLAWADLVLAAQALSLLHGITAWGLLVAHALLASGAAAVWMSAGRPSPPKFALPSRGQMARSIRDWPDLWTLGLVVGAAYVLLALINVLVPPNNPDSYVYHLTKVAYWIQHRTLAPWPTPCAHQVHYPFNAEIGSLESMIFLKNDLLTGFGQWFAALAAMTAVFGLARLFGSSRVQAAFASGVFLSLPMIVLQSTTTQTDLTLGAMVSAMAFLVLLGLKTRHQGMLIVSGAALGLALGMKLTAFLIIPGFLVGLAYVSLVRKPRPIRLLLVWAGACLAGFAMLGAFNYVQGRLFDRHLRSGPPKAVSRPLQSQKDDAASLAGPRPALRRPVRARSEGSPAVKTAKSEILNLSPFRIRMRLSLDLTLIRCNLARDIVSFLDFTGLPQPLADPAARLRAAIGRRALASLLVPKKTKRVTAYTVTYDFQDPRPQPSEARSFFGPLGFLVWLPLVLYWSLAGFIKRDSRLIPALSFLGFMVLSAGSQFWSPFRGRYYCLVVALGAPLVASLYGRGRRRGTLRAVICLVAIVGVIVTMLTNIQKPLIGPGAIWTKTRMEMRSAAWAQGGVPTRVMEEFMPATASVATVLKDTDPEYVWFGERLTRRLTPIFPAPKVIDRAWLQKNACDWVVVHTMKFRRVAPLPPEEFRVIVRPPYTLISRLK